MEDVGRAALERALERHDLIVHYQPIHDARTRSITAAEALLRQQRASGEIREAGVIAAAAERTSHLFALGSWMMRTAIADAAAWQRNAPGVTLNVNVSARELLEADVVSRVTDLMAGARIDPRRFAVEITETFYIPEPEVAAAPLRELRASGIGIWLDDFGTRHSALTYLQHFPATGIKIPAEFVATLPNDRRCRSITCALIELAHDLGLQVVAEGIEREEQVDFLLEHDCDAMQGFLLGRPMSADELAQAVDGC